MPGSIAKMQGLKSRCRFGLDILLTLAQTDTPYVTFSEHNLVLPERSQNLGKTTVKINEYGCNVKYDKITYIKRIRQF